jgi:acetylornithine deacetylase/succinyl-diaminopimelate desuccinylase-like protein
VLPNQSNLKLLAQTRIQQLGLPYYSSYLYLSNEACLLGRKGIDCVVFGPGALANNLHSPNEYVEIDQAQKAYELYKHWIQEEENL